VAFLSSQSRFGAQFQPSIEIVIQGLLRRVQIAASVSLTDHIVQMSLSVPKTTAHGLVQVFPLLGFGIAAVVHTPRAANVRRAVPSDRLFVPQTPPLMRGTRVAHERELFSSSG
jgi:hypothetical protein